MIVKDLSFEKTRGIILRNKFQFLNQQLKQSQNRNQKLEQHNKSLKSKIRSLKTNHIFKSKKKQYFDQNDKYSSYSILNQQTMKFNNGVVPVNDKKQLQSQLSQMNIKTQDKEKQDRIDIKQIEDYYQKMYKQKVKKLRRKQDKIKCLKEKINHYNKNNGEIVHKDQLNCLDINENTNITKVRKVNSVIVPQKTIALSKKVVTNDSNKISARNRGIMGPFTIRLKNQYPHQRSSQFLQNQIKLPQTLNNSLYITKRSKKEQIISRNSSSKFIHFSKINQSTHNLNDSLNCSKMSNCSSNSAFMIRNKSYSKVITTLQCEGCRYSFKPNLYYNHLQECREYLLYQLQKQQNQIDQQINQTINLSYH